MHNVLVVSGFVRSALYFLPLQRLYERFCDAMGCQCENSKLLANHFGVLLCSHNLDATSCTGSPTVLSVFTKWVLKVSGVLQV